MVIFIPLFIGIFIIAPMLVTWMIASLFGLRGFMIKLVLFMIISVLNWNHWQLPSHPVVASVQGR